MSAPAVVVAPIKDVRGIELGGGNQTRHSVGRLAYQHQCDRRTVQPQAPSVAAFRTAHSLCPRLPGTCAPCRLSNPRCRSRIPSPQFEVANGQRTNWWPKHCPSLQGLAFMLYVTLGRDDEPWPRGAKSIDFSERASRPVSAENRQVEIDVGKAQAPHDAEGRRYCAAARSEDVTSAAMNSSSAAKTPTPPGEFDCQYGRTALFRRFRPCNAL